MVWTNKLHFLQEPLLFLFQQNPQLLKHSPRSQFLKELTLFQPHRHKFQPLFPLTQIIVFQILFQILFQVPKLQPLLLIHILQEFQLQLLLLMFQILVRPHLL